MELVPIRHFGGHKGGTRKGDLIWSDQHEYCPWCDKMVADRPEHLVEECTVFLKVKTTYPAQS